MFPPTKPRKPDRLDDFPKGSLLHEEIKTEFTRIRGLVRELTDKGGAIVLGVQKGERFDYRLPVDALTFECEVKDLLGVLRRMSKSRELRYEEYEWEHPLMKGQVWKWYVKREDWDEKKRDRRTSRTGDGEPEGNDGVGTDWADDTGDEWE